MVSRVVVRDARCSRDGLDIVQGVGCEVCCMRNPMLLNSPYSYRVYRVHDVDQGSNFGGPVTVLDAFLFIGSSCLFSMVVRRWFQTV